MAWNSSSTMNTSCCCSSVVSISSLCFFCSLAAVHFFIVIPRRLTCCMHIVVVILAGKFVECSHGSYVIVFFFFSTILRARHISMIVKKCKRNAMAEEKKEIHRKIKTIHTRNESHKEFVIIILCVQSSRSLSSLFSLLNCWLFLIFYFWIINAYHCNFCHPLMDRVKSINSIVSDWRHHNQYNIITIFKTINNGIIFEMMKTQITVKCLKNRNLLKIQICQNRSSNTSKQKNIIQL